MFGIEFVDPQAAELMLSGFLDLPWGSICSGAAVTGRYAPLRSTVSGTALLAPSPTERHEGNGVNGPDHAVCWCHGDHNVAGTSAVLGR